jgi:hypothetical protein
MAVMALGMALAGGVDFLPDTFLLKRNNKQLEDTIQAKVRADQFDTTNNQHLSFIAQTQLALRVLGFYNGRIDGVWGRASAKAKVAFESDPKFAPCTPNGGAPFDLSMPLPACLFYDAKSCVIRVRQDHDPVDHDDQDDQDDHDDPNQTMIGFGDK